MSNQLEAWLEYCQRHQLKSGVYVTGAGQISYLSGQKLTLNQYEESLYTSDSLSHADRQIGFETVNYLRTFFAQFN